MKNLKIAAAVAACVAGCSGAFASDLTTTVDVLTNFNSATDVILTVAGASAARNSFGLELSPLKDDGSANPTALCSTSTTASDRFDIYRSNAASGRDFRAYSCRLGTVATSGANTNLNGRRAVIFYRSEGGSAWGVLGLVANQMCTSGATTPCVGGGGSTIKRLTVSAANCAATPSSVTGVIGALATLTTDCTVTGYDFESDGAAAAGVSEATTEFAVADVEPNMFAIPVNYPQSGKFKAFVGGAVTTAGSTKAALNPINTASVRGFGEIFGVLVSNSVTTPNLNTQDLVGLFTGAIGDWGSVPDYTSSNAFNPAGAVKICRREPGSGTQVLSQAAYLGHTCNPSAPQFLAGNGSTVIENTTGGALNTCMQSTTGTIGISVLGAAPSGTHFVTINGAPFTRTAAALGTYPYTSELTFTQRPALATSNVNGSRLATILTTRGQSATSMPNNVSTFGIPGVGGNVPVLPVSATNPIALGTRNKSTCNPAALTN